MTTQTVPMAAPVEVAEQLSRGGRIRLIDVRTAPEFNDVHARGAEHVPLDQLDARAIVESLSGEPVYFICKSGARAAKARQAVVGCGYEHASCVEGGTDAWVRAGLPVVRGAKRSVSLERQVRIAAGSIVLIGLALAWFVSPWFALISGFVGAGLVFSGVTDTCGMGMLLSKMPWNR